MSFLLLLSAALTAVHARPPVVDRAEFPTTLLARQDATINAKTPFDHSWVANFAALGDSYAAGLGAGHAISASPGLVLNTDCYQYSYGYANLLNSDSMIGVNPRRTFEYLPCSGAKVPDVDSQIGKMSSSDVVTLSIGGNDLGFVDIINYCIFQWNTWEPFYTCQGELDRAKGVVNGDDFAKSIAGLIKKVEGKLKNSNSRIYWTGYEKFWNADTPECDKVTWSFTRKFGFRQYLTQDRRKQMNELTDTLNQKIQDACKTVDRCVFVDSNAQVEQQEGQFCAPGVDETYNVISGGVSRNRELTTTYEWGTTKDDDVDDDNSDRPLKRAVQPVIKIDNSTWEGSVAWLVREGLKDDSMDPNITQASITGLDGLTATTDQVTLGLPDYYAKIFHRTKWGNGIVAVNVLKAMDTEQGKIMKQPATATTVTLCDPTQGAATITTTTTNSAPACTGNQIQGTCTQGHLPSSTPNSGPEQPVCDKVGSGSSVRISDTKAKQAATEYCNNLINGKVVLNAKNTSPAPGTVANAAENGGQLSLTVLFDVNVCDPNTSADNQKVDFGAMSLDTCFMNMYTNLAMACAQDSTWQDFNKDFPLEGGVYGYGCALWAMSGDKV